MVHWVASFNSSKLRNFLVAIEIRLIYFYLNVLFGDIIVSVSPIIGPRQCGEFLESIALPHGSSSERLGMHAHFHYVLSPHLQALVSKTRKQWSISYVEMISLSILRGKTIQNVKLGKKEILDPLMIKIDRKHIHVHSFFRNKKSNTTCRMDEYRCRFA